MEDLQTLVDQADVAALLRAVDGLCASRDWDRLADLARRCRDAIELGRQLWGVATHIDYRLAWEAPGPWAAAVLRPGAGRFALGPLPEVAASTHDWASVTAHLDEPVSRATFAQERVLRGENLTHEDVGRFGDAAAPLRLEAWEPAYALPRYRDRSAEFSQPEVAVRHIALDSASLRPPPVLDPDEGVEALESVVETWSGESAGIVQAVLVEGRAKAAVSAVRAVGVEPAPGGAVGLLRVEPGEALALLQWCGASGGAYGRRRGGASGRFSAWWAAAALTGLDWPADDPPPADWAAELGEAIGELHWYRWADERPDTGWTLRLAVEDPADGLAWAVDALDRRADPLNDPSTQEPASGETP